MSVPVCLRVCVSLCVFVPGYMYLYLCVYFCVPLCACVSLCVYVCLCECICVFVCVRLYFCVHAYVYMFVCIFVCVCVCVCMCMCVCLCVHPCMGVCPPSHFRAPPRLCILSFPPGGCQWAPGLGECWALGSEEGVAAGTGCSLGSFGREKEENRSQGSLGSREEFSRGGETWGCLKAEREGHLENAGDESRE